MKKLRVTIEGKVYEVLVEILDEGTSPATIAAANHGHAHAVAAVHSTSVETPAATAVLTQAPTGSTGGDGAVPSPLAGKVVSIDVKSGDQVADGAQVATIEAMKMNTYIFAPKAGRVGAILVAPGDGVEEGTVLLRIT